ncbi:MAG: hypothetical protein H6722_01795 [Sandaracinus sp.]|nr:hypothetical protein [Sandaracinus sp.]
MMRAWRRAFVVVAFVALVALVAPRRTGPPSPGSTRVRFDAGMQALDAGRFRDAADEFERSFELAPRLPTAFNWALALRGLGEALQAERLYQRLLDGELGTLRGRDRASVEALQAEVRATIGELRLTLEGPNELEARLDTVPVAEAPGSQVLRVDPGEHVIVVGALDHQSTERRFTTVPGGVVEVTIRLEASVDERPSTLLLRSTEADTYFVVEGHAEGVAPLRAELPPGRYAVLVRGPHGERTTEVEVPAGRRVALTLDPPERSVLRRPWFWVVTGVVVAGLVAGAVALTTIEREAPPIDNEVFPPVFALTASP